MGSQSILAAHEDTDLPDQATVSAEADVMYLRDWSFDLELTEMADAYFGEGSRHETHGVHLQGVDESTCVLPTGWRARLVPLPASARLAASVLCLDPHDLAVAKLAAGRLEDIDVHALLTGGHLDPDEVRRCADGLDATEHPGAEEMSPRRLASLVGPRRG